MYLLIRSKSEIPLKLKDFTIVLADSSLNFKLKADSYVEQSPGSSAVDFQTHAIDGAGILMQPQVCYRLSLSAGQYKFTENEELRVSKFLSIFKQRVYNVMFVSQILRLDMSMGSDKNHAVLSMQSGFNKVKLFKAYNPHLDSMADVTVNNICYIVPASVNLCVIYTYFA